MKEEVLSIVYAISKDVVARDIQGEIVIVPIARGIGDMEGDIYSLNSSARMIWEKIDGKRSGQAILAELCERFSGAAEPGEIEKDVLGLLQELSQRRIIVPSSGKN